MHLMGQLLHLLVEWGWDMRHHHEVEMLFEDELGKVSTFSRSCSSSKNCDLYFYGTLYLEEVQELFWSYP